jgi:hypothetical protein
MGRLAWCHNLNIGFAAAVRRDDESKKPRVGQTTGLSMKSGRCAAGPIGPPDRNRTCI